MDNCKSVMDKTMTTHESCKKYNFVAPLNELVRVLLFYIKKNFQPGLEVIFFWALPANIYLFKVNKRNARKKFKICSKLTIKTLDWRQWSRSGVLIINFEHILHLFLLFLLFLFFLVFFFFFWLFFYWLKILSCNTKNLSLISAISWDEHSALLCH